LIALSGHAQSNNSKTDQKENNMTQATQPSSGPVAPRTETFTYTYAIVRESIAKLTYHKEITALPVKDFSYQQSCGPEYLTPWAILQQLATKP
jgi:hypothetical protein